MGLTLIPKLHQWITTVQIWGQNDIISTKWQRRFTQVIKSLVLENKILLKKFGVTQDFSFHPIEKKKAVPKFMAIHPIVVLTFHPKTTNAIGTVVLEKNIRRSVNQWVHLFGTTHMYRIYENLTSSCWTKGCRRTICLTNRLSSFCTPLAWLKN